VLTVGSLFSGIGLLDYGLHLAGLRHTWFCERDEWRRGILKQRWPGVPVLDDVRAVGADTVPRVDGIVGGFPCKGASSAGKREGFGHPETVLWREMARAVGELRPRYVVVENVADLLALHDGECWGEVVGTLAALGYDTTWDCLPAGAVGAPHGRDRVFAVAAYTDESSPDPHAAASRSRAATRERASAAADANGVARASRLARDWRSGALGEPGEVERAQRLHAHAEAVADSCGGRRSEREAEHGAEPARPYANPVGRGVPVEWGEYGPAVERWEAVIGRAPEPLVRRVDDRSAMRMERSRLSALGDGVQVQVGYLVGRYVIELEEERLAA
jgi:DNA (cytosine-5)-methyltransferase 1